MWPHHEYGGERTTATTDTFSRLISLQQDIWAVHSYASPGQRHVIECDVDRGLQIAWLVDLPSDIAAIANPL